jgi:hypothetical protein
VYYKSVELDERSLVEEQLEAFAGRQLAFLVLRLEARLAAALLGLGPPLLQQFELLSHRHCREKLTLGGMSI